MMNVVTEHITKTPGVCGGKACVAGTLAGADFEGGGKSGGYGLLEAYLPKNNVASKQDDLRDFYWYYLWHQRHNELVTLNTHSNFVTSVVFSPDGKTLASGNYDKTVKVWDVSERRELATLKGHSEFVGTAVFSPDGKTLASGSWDETVKLWTASRHTDEELKAPIGVR